MRCKALKPTSDSRLQDFLGTLQSFEAYLRFQPADSDEAGHAFQYEAGHLFPLVRASSEW
jgi:hypothetical protein